MRRRTLVVISVVGLVALSCGNQPVETRSGPSSSSSSQPPSSPPKALSDDQVYEGTGMVFEEAKRPRLCLGPTHDTLPPCEGTDLRGWSWEGLDFDEVGDTRYGRYTIRGTYVDGVFTLTDEPEVPKPYEGDGDSITAPCDEPESGWEMPDPQRTTEDDRLAATRAAEDEPDFSGAWIDYIEEPTTEEEMQPWGPSIVLVLAFTGDAERHEVAAREHWGGALCVWVADRTEKELSDIQTDLSEGWIEDMGIETTWSSTDITVGVVEIGVILSTPEFEAELDRRYGEGVVVVFPALRPVE
jgi:hypothetical protein